MKFYGSHVFVCRARICEGKGRGHQSWRDITAFPPGLLGIGSDIRQTKEIVSPSEVLLKLDTLPLRVFL